MRYPEQLVNKFGGKAGVLMYVAQELPDIPQAPMMVKTPNEDVDAFLDRAKNLRWPRLFRSSAYEELFGFEGEFPTKKNMPDLTGFHGRSGFDEYLRRLILQIENSPAQMKAWRADLKSDKICVIAAEMSESHFSGTYIKHPNQEGVYLGSIKPPGEYSIAEPVLWSQKTGRVPIVRLGKIDAEGLEEVIEWHDRIAGLPLMDKEWTYQIEFGLEPACLYQVRAFRPVKRASFSVAQNPALSFKYLAFGVTPPEGLNLRVTDENEQGIFIGNLRYAGMIGRDNLPAAIFENAFGVLTHSDVTGIRKTDICLLLFGDKLSLQYAKGELINIKSDGINVNIARV